MKICFFTCTWFSLGPQTFNSHRHSGCISKTEKNRCSRCCCCYSAFLFRSHALDKFQKAISWSRSWRYFLHRFFPKYVVSDHFRWGNVPVNQNKLRTCLHFDQIRTWHRCLKLSFFGLYIFVRSLKTVPSGLAMIEIIFTRPLTIYNSSEPLNSALFSRAKPLHSPRLVKLNSFNFDGKRCNASKGFRALFI